MRPSRTSLHAAWRRIQANALLSSASETRIAIEMFDREARKNISQIQRRLRDKSFEFEPQKGVLKKKASGGQRGIVMASVHNRIVERAWLDCLQSKLSFVRRVIDQPTSVGGVPHRSVPHGLKIIYDAFQEDKLYYVRSDIAGFFDNIPRKHVLERIAKETDDQNFLEVLAAATTVVLANEKALGDDRSVFPTDDQGIAQGSPLSPLFGNILLHDFDLEFNQRDITCVRFIDDFVILGKTERSVDEPSKAPNPLCSNLD